MSSPAVGDWRKLKRAVRYLIHQPTVIYKYRWQDCEANGIRPVSAYVDTDFAGCTRTRRSTSGGMLFVGDHLVKHWASTGQALGKHIHFMGKLGFGACLSPCVFHILRVSISRPSTPYIILKGDICFRKCAAVHLGDPRHPPGWHAPMF